MNTDKIKRFILTGAVVALIAAIPLSISRTLFFSTTICAFFMVIAFARKPQHFGKVLIGAIGILFMAGILSQLSFFQTALDAFTARFTGANESEGGLVNGVIGDRYFGGMITAVTNSANIPFFGLGLGMGTNVGSQLLTGTLTFLVSEGEWGRLIGEMGLLLGLLVILLRLSFCFEMTVMAYQRLTQDDVLPWMMLSFALLVIPQGQWSQPTSLGFSSLAGGLVLASLNKKVG